MDLLHALARGGGMDSFYVSLVERLSLLIATLTIFWVDWVSNAGLWGLLEADVVDCLEQKSPRWVPLQRGESLGVDR